jgi:hypothetical protein
LNIPGDPLPEEHQQAYELVHQRAVEVWGDDRAEALGDSLREASLSILRLERVRFSRNDAPVFFLHKQAPGGAQ